MPLHVSSTCAHHQEVKSALHSLWYHHTYKCDDTRSCVINQLDAQNFCFTISLFHVSTCFEHICSSSRGQNCITKPLVSSHLQVWWYQRLCNYPTWCTKFLFYNKFISCLYMFRAHVLIIKRSCRCDDTRGCVIQFWPPDDEHMCSKHVETWNKLIVKRNFCASSWLITEINSTMLCMKV